MANGQLEKYRKKLKSSKKFRWKHQKETYKKGLSSIAGCPLSATPKGLQLFHLSLRHGPCLHGKHLSSDECCSPSGCNGSLHQCHCFQPTEQTRQDNLDCMESVEPRIDYIKKIMHQT